jgi:hypothetical protein
MRLERGLRVPPALLLPPPTLDKGGHSGLERRGIAVCRRAVLVTSERERPHRWRTYGRCVNLHNVPDRGGRRFVLRTLIDPALLNSTRRNRRRCKSNRNFEKLNNQFCSGHFRHLVLVMAPQRGPARAPPGGNLSISSGHKNVRQGLMYGERIKDFCRYRSLTLFEPPRLPIAECIQSPTDLSHLLGVLIARSPVQCSQPSQRGPAAKLCVTYHDTTHATCTQVIRFAPNELPVKCCGASKDFLILGRTKGAPGGVP